MPELDDQLRHYFNATAPAVDAKRRSDEPDVLVSIEAPAGRQPRQRGPFVVAVVVAIVVVGGYFLFRGEEAPGSLDTVDNSIVDDEIPSAEELRPARLIAPGSWSVAAAVVGDASPAQLESTAVEIQSWPEVLEVAVAADAEGWRRLTGFGSDGCSSGVSEPPCGPGVVVLVVKGSAELVASRLESELSMTTIAAHRVPWDFASAYFSAAVEVASPVPLRFDPSDLGREIVLGGPYLDVSEADGCPISTCDVGVDVDFEGASAGLSVTLAPPGSEDELPSPPGTGLLIVGAGGAGGIGYRSVADLLPGPEGAATVAGFIGSPLTAHRQWWGLVGLPLEVAVVSVELVDGSTVWQRPIAGMTFLFDEPDSFSEGDMEDSTMTAFDEDGTVILRIKGGEGSDPVVTDLRVSVVQTEAARATGPVSPVEAGGLSVTWAEASWGDDGASLHTLVGTPMGILGEGRNGSIVRWVDGTHWEPVEALAGLDVSSLVDGVEFVLASGTSRIDGVPILLRSVDGENWIEIDRGPLDGLGTNILATSPSGLTLIGMSHAFLIDGGRVTDLHEVPWSVTSGSNLRELVEFDGSVVAFEGDLSGVGGRSAWRYLGDGEWAPPVAVPVARNIEVSNGLVLSIDATDSIGADCCAPPVGAESTSTLLTSIDGTEWTTHARLNNPTTNGLQIESGDFFSLYGLIGTGGSQLSREGEFATLWISADAVSWAPLDISFSDTFSGVVVAGDTIFIAGADQDGRPDRYWIGRVEIR